MTQTPRIVYRTRDDATPDDELSALVVIYQLCIRSHARKEAAPDSRPDDGRKVKGESASEHPST